MNLNLYIDWILDWIATGSEEGYYDPEITNYNFSELRYTNQFEVLLLPLQNISGHYHMSFLFYFKMSLFVLFERLMNFGCSC